MIYIMACIELMYVCTCYAVFLFGFVAVDTSCYRPVYFFTDLSKKEIKCTLANEIEILH